MKIVLLIVVAAIAGCGTAPETPDCEGVTEVRQCPRGSDVVCDGPVIPVDQPILNPPRESVTGCLVWQRIVASEPLIPGLCVAACE